MINGHEIVTLILISYLYLNLIIFMIIMPPNCKLKLMKYDFELLFQCVYANLFCPNHFQLDEILISINTFMKSQLDENHDLPH